MLQSSGSRGLEYTAKIRFHKRLAAALVSLGIPSVDEYTCFHENIHDPLWRFRIMSFQIILGIYRVSGCELLYYIGVIQGLQIPPKTLLHHNNLQLPLCQKKNSRNCSGSVAFT